LKKFFQIAMLNIFLFSEHAFFNWLKQGGQRHSDPLFGWPTPNPSPSPLVRGPAPNPPPRPPCSGG
jgi:hypothetical protein